MSVCPLVFIGDIDDFSRMHKTSVLCAASEELLREAVIILVMLNKGLYCAGIPDAEG